MNTGERKLVFAPWGANTYGEDILLFEHGLIFALQTAVEAAGGFVYADIHDALGGGEKREKPAPPLSESDIRALAARAQCEAFIDGMLAAERDPRTAGLTQVTVSLRVFFPRENRFEAPDSFTFKAFQPDGSPDALSLDYDLYIALQYRLCEALLHALGCDFPRTFLADSLQITPSWLAYAAFLKGKRATKIPENKQGFYEQAIRSDPHFFWALFNSGMLYKTQTDYHAMRNRMLKAAAATDDPALLGDVYFELGIASIYLGDTKTARNFWEKAREYASDNPTLRVNLAGTYEQEENWQEAMRLNEQALALDPDYHKALVSLARLHAMFGHLDQSIPLYERALEVQPDDALRHSVLGGCYLAAGRPEDARVQFERAIALDPDSDPGKYARQELEKLAPPPDDEPPKKRRSLW